MSKVNADSYRDVTIDALMGIQDEAKLRRISKFVNALAQGEPGRTIEETTQMLGMCSILRQLNGRDFLIAKTFADQLLTNEQGGAS